MTLAVVNNRKRHNFEVEIEGKIAFTHYRLEPGVITLSHTEVPPEFSGRGIGGVIARAALEHARREGLKVVAKCPFIAGWMRRHPEYNDLLV